MRPEGSKSEFGDQGGAPPLRPQNAYFSSGACSGLQNPGGLRGNESEFSGQWGVPPATLPPALLVSPPGLANPRAGEEFFKDMNSKRPEEYFGGNDPGRSPNAAGRRSDQPERPFHQEAPSTGKVMEVMLPGVATMKGN